MQISFLELIDKSDKELLQKMLSKKDIISFVLSNGKNPGIAEWIGRMHPLASLTVTYLVGGVISLVLYYILGKRIWNS